MTVSKSVAAEIRRLYFAEHWRRGTIAAQLGVHFDVVVRVLGSFGPKGGSPRPDARLLGRTFPSSTRRSRAIRGWSRRASRTCSSSAATRAAFGRCAAMSAKRGRRRATRCSCASKRCPASRHWWVDWAHVELAARARRTPRALGLRDGLAWPPRAMWAELVVDLGVDSLCRSLVRAVAHSSGAARVGGCSITCQDHRHRALGRRRSLFTPRCLDLASHLRAMPALCGRENLKKRARSSEPIRASGNDSSRRARYPPCSTLQRAARRVLRDHRPSAAAPAPGLSDEWSTCSTRNARACPLALPEPCRRPTRSAPIAVEQDGLREARYQSLFGARALRTAHAHARRRRSARAPGGRRRGRAPRALLGTPSDGFEAREAVRSWPKRARPATSGTRPRNPEVPGVVALLERWVEAGLEEHRLDDRLHHQAARRLRCRGAARCRRRHARARSARPRRDGDPLRADESGSWARER